MKKFLLIVFLFSFHTFLKSQNIGIGTSTPDSSALLEVKSENKGFLPPRVILISSNSASPVTKPAQGLLVYNLVSAGSAPNDVHPGYYFWNGSKWTPLENRCNNIGDMQYWNGIGWSTIPIGSSGQVLTIVNGVPQWADCACLPLSGVLSIQPASNPFEGAILTNNPTTFGNGSDQLLMEDWTIFGNEFTVRQLIKFDFGTTLTGKTVDSARLYLYVDSTPNNGDMISPHAGSANACYIQRITSNWITYNQYTWNNQPTTTATNQAIIPQSSTAFDDNIIDVTALIKDLQTFGNNGIMIRLQNEQLYNLRQYESSFSTRTTKRPKLIIYYH